MKQLIVLVATVVLGITLAGTVVGMGGGVETLTGTVSNEIESRFVTTGEDGAHSLNINGFSQTE